MKRTILYPLLTLYLFIFPNGQAIASDNDSIRLSLLTCAPGEEIYSLFGHTAIRYEDPANGIDAVFNYGLFSFNTPNFILRFSLGETDYQLGATDYARFAAEYAFDGRSVWQQTLNLSKEEKAELIRLLQENYLPENRVYRYNFFYDNCATRPRDKIEESIDGKVIYPAEPQDGSLSFRDIVHQYCKGHPWARFGIDLCIGSEADRPITQRQMMFAPFYLMDAFAGTQIVHDSVQRPLVSGKELIVDALPEEEEGGWMPTPFQCSLLLFILTAAATIYSIRKRTGLWGVDLILFGAAGIVGCVLAFLALFSEHPAVSSNFLLLVFHPGQLLILSYIIYCVRKGKKCWYLTLNLVVLTLFMVLFPLIPQRFDLAVVPLALCLLIRSASNLILTSKKK
ncbi:lipoprotein N-acyltransferase Lnb [Bacteroides thetaiotaomicron]|uniref:lipoprotein N-acyltransferase Lnb n=1 Tax=Bacteroides thetaiotaomicron TaxID=818 RepID=UPI0034A4D3C2